MKRGILALIVSVLILSVLIWASLPLNEEGSEDEGLIGNLKGVFLLKWLTEGVFGDGTSYGKCVEDIQIEGSEFCNPNNENSNVIYAKFRKCEGDYYGNEYSSAISQCSTNQVCSEGECVYPPELGCKDENGEVIIPGACEECDYSLDVPEIVEKGDGSECGDGTCQSGSCVEVNCAYLEENQGYSECGDSCCASGESCCGGDTDSPICCGNGEGKCNTDMDLQTKLEMEKEFKKVFGEGFNAKGLGEILEYLQDKHEFHTIPKETMAKLTKLDPNLEEQIANVFEDDDMNFLVKSIEIGKLLFGTGLTMEEIPYLIRLKNFVEEAETMGIPRDKLETIGIIISSFDSRIFAFCQKEENDCEEGLKLCPGSLGSACCPVSGPGSFCLKYESKLYSIVQEDVSSYPEHTIGACGNEIPYEYDARWTALEYEEVKKQTCRDIGKFYCGELDSQFGVNFNEDGIVCCETGKETCVSENPYNPSVSIIWDFYPPTCQPASCEEEYSSCDDGVYRICCKDGVESCAKSDSTSGSSRNYLRCVNTAERVDNPSNTRGTSVYMVRDVDEFELNGKAYVIEPSVLFSKDVSITFNEAVSLGEDVHKYTNHDAVLESCDSEKLIYTVKNIGANGGEINLNDEVVMNIPSGAIDKNIEFSVTSYDLSNCYEVGKKTDIVGIPSAFEDSYKNALKKEYYKNTLFGIGILIVIGIGIFIFKKKLVKGSKKKKKNSK